MRKSFRALAATAATGTFLLAACSTTPSGAANKSSKSSTKAPIKIALLDSTTGPAGPQYARAAQGFLARVELQNAKGGVNGHKIDPIVVNDAGQFTQEQSIVQGAVETKGAFGIVSVTPFMFAAYRWLTQNGIPVTGASSDGPEWATSKSTNMFASDTGGITPKSQQSTALSKAFVKVGGKKASVATLGYSISPLSSQAAKGAAIVAKKAGLEAPYVNTSITFGATDFTSEALAIKQSGANVVVPEMDANSNFALIQELKNAGAKTTGLLATGLTPTAVKTAAWTALQGSYFLQAFQPSQLDTKATKAVQAALQKYQHVPTSTFPDWVVYESWLGATAMIKGLQLAGSNLTRSNVIAKMRKVTSFDGGGLLAHSIDWATILKKPGPSCFYLVKATKSGFSPVGTKPLCGTVVPGSGSGS